MLCTVTENREPLCLSVPPSSNPNAKTMHTQHETVNVSRSALTPKIMSLEIFHLTSLQLENAPIPTLHGHTAKDKNVRLLYTCSSLVVSLTYKFDRQQCAQYLIL